MRNFDMPVFSGESEAKRDEEKLFQERRSFVAEHYPLDESDYDLEDLVGDSLDGKEVAERRDESGDIEGFLTYETADDGEGVPYCSLGIALTREESRGEGIMNELFADVVEVAKTENCEYIVGIADTLGGEEFLLSKGFYTDFDKVTNRDYFRFDLE